MDPRPTIRTPVAVKTLAAALELKVSEVIAVLVFRLHRSDLNIHSMLGSEDVRRVAQELGRLVRIEGEDEANGKPRTP